VSKQFLNGTSAIQHTTGYSVLYQLDEDKICDKKQQATEKFGTKESSVCAKFHLY